MKCVHISVVVFFVVCFSIACATAAPLQRHVPNASIRQRRKVLKDTLEPSIVGGDDVFTDDPQVEVTNMANLIIISRSASSLKYETCTATVLNRRWLLTAAHCLTSSDGLTVSFEETHTFIGELSSTLRIGNTNIRPYRFKRYLIHKNYNPLNDAAGSDIAMIEVDRQIAFNRYSKVDLARTPADDPKPGETVIAAGYGLTKLESFTEFEFSKRLQKAPLDIRSFDKCKELSSSSWRPFLSDQKLICAGSSTKGNNGPTDTCIGDSGGPLFRERSGRGRSVQVAITSFATTSTCAGPNTVSWYTRVSQFNTDITQALDNNFSAWKVISS